MWLTVEQVKFSEDYWLFVFPAIPKEKWFNCMRMSINFSLIKDYRSQIDFNHLHGVGQDYTIKQVAKWNFAFCRCSSV